MTNKLKYATQYFKNLSSGNFIILMSIIIVFVSLTFQPLKMLYTKYISDCGSINNIIGNEPLEGKIFILSILAPIVETFIFQFFIIEILLYLKIFIKHKKIIAFISAFFFGISHSYSYIYMLFGCTTGLLFAYSYLVYREKRMYPFLIVLSIHSLSNSIILIINTIC